MIDDATRDMMPGIFIKFWTSGKLFNLSRLKASTALKEKVICELLCAGGCAFVAHTIGRPLVHDQQICCGSWSLQIYHQLEEKQGYPLVHGWNSMCKVEPQNQHIGVGNGCSLFFKRLSDVEEIIRWIKNTWFACEIASWIDTCVVSHRTPDLVFILL